MTETIITALGNLATVIVVTLVGFGVYMVIYLFRVYSRTDRRLERFEEYDYMTDTDDCLRIEDHLEPEETEVEK